MKSFMSKDSRGVYYLYYLGEDGKRKRKSLRTKDYKKALEAIISDKPTPECLSSIAEIILNHAKNDFTHSTYLIYRLTFKYLVNFLGSNKRVTDITMDDIERFKNSLNVKPTTINIRLRVIKAGFNYLIDKGILTKNPAKKVKQLSIGESERKIYTESEYQKLISVVDNPIIKFLIQFAYYTGCRLSELLNLQWNDIDLVEKTILIRNKETFKTKNGKIRKIPISDKLLKIIEEMDTGSSYVFKSPVSQHYEKWSISKLMTKYKTLAGLPKGLTFHCLRHTFITNLIKKGASIYKVKKLAGHSNITTTEIYAHLNVENLRDEVNFI